MKLETYRSSNLPHHSRIPSEIMLIVNQPGRLAEIYSMKGQREEQQEPVLSAYYYHNDHLGTPQLMTDGEQKVVWKASYDAFGLADISVNEAESDLRFPGRYFDGETGLHYNYFRDYDPGLGRYIQSDPIGLQGGLNTYGYVGGNPVRYVDPLGLRASYCQRPLGDFSGGNGSGPLYLTTNLYASLCWMVLCGAIVRTIRIMIQTAFLDRRLDKHRSLKGIMKKILSVKILTTMKIVVLNSVSWSNGRNLVRLMR